MRRCWIDIYIERPDLVTHDAGKQFVTKVFQTNSALLHVDTKCVPIESPNSMSYVERYHTQIRHAYKIVTTEAPDLDAGVEQQIALKSVNDSIGPDGLVPTLLVYGSLPRLGFRTDKPTPPTFQRAVALRKATEAMSKHFAKSQVSNAVRTRNGPDTSHIHSAPLKSHVLLYRPERDGWDGRWPLLDIQGETCKAILPPQTGPKQCRTTVVKRLIPDDDNQIPPRTNDTLNLLQSGNDNNIVTAHQYLSVTIQSKEGNGTLKDELDDIVAFAAKMVPQSTDHKNSLPHARKKSTG